MEAVVDIKYRPALFRHGGGVVGPTTKRGYPATDPATGMYLECLRNHAASAGGHVVDGCGEFMPAAPAAPLRCAACGCHRSFHRRVVLAADPPPPPPRLALLPPPSVVVKAAPPHLLRRGGGGGDEDHRTADGAWNDDETDEDSDYYDGDGRRPMSPLPAPALPSTHLSPAPPRHTLLPLPAAAAPSPTAALAASSWPPPPPVPGAPLATARKRFRSKFSPEQKRRMRELSERVGWRLRRRDGALVADACRDIGVTRGVFKVWMHNNKHNFVAAHRTAPAAQLQPCSHMAALAAVSAPPTPPPPVLHADDFNINADADADADAEAGYYVAQPATASGGAPQPS